MEHYKQIPNHLATKTTLLKVHHRKITEKTKVRGTVSLCTPHGRITFKLYAIAISGIQHIKENPHTIFYIKQFRKKKRSLHETTARKDRKNKNLTQKRNKKNTKEMKGIHLNDTVRIFGKIGFVSGFTTTGLYIKDIHNAYITKPGKTYKQVGFKDVTVKNHNNNWQFISHLAPD